MGGSPKPFKAVIAVGRLRIEPCAIGFSGRISSGKTTVSQAVAEALQWPRASFGDFVRTVASNRGLAVDSREVLQEIGVSLISKGWPEFCRDVLAAAGWQPGSAIVVDGIRHAEAVQHLSEIVAPLPFVLVHVRVDEQVRNERLLRRDGAAVQAEVESHSTEAAVKDILPRMADLTVDASWPMDRIIAEVIAYLESRGGDSIQQ